MWLTRKGKKRVLLLLLSLKVKLVMRLRWKFLLLLAYLIGQAAAGNAHSEVWFAPMDRRHAREIAGTPAGAVDFMRLFRDDRAWEQVREQVNVFKLYPDFMRRVSDSDL